MNYPKEFYVTTPIVGDKVWLDSVRFVNGKKAFHGPWWIKDVRPIGSGIAIILKRENGIESTVMSFQLLRMSKTQIKKMTVLKNPV